MTLEEQVNADIKSAMLAKETAKLEALRGIKSAILLLKTSPEGLTTESELKMLVKLVKQRKESAEIFAQQNRNDLADAELFQSQIIEKYLPKQLSEAEVTEELKKIISQVNASSAADLGKVMGVATKAMAGKADGKLISTLLKQLLA